MTGPPLVGPDTYPLVVDYYELTMAAAFVAAGMEQEASFELFVRRLPESRSFLVAAGVEDAIEALLVETNEVQQDVAHRAARLYRFDERKYRQLARRGFRFET